jgi:IS30 family transposase
MSLTGQQGPSMMGFEHEANKVARQLNERPPDTLQFETPAERFNTCVASTG